MVSIDQTNKAFFQHYGREPSVCAQAPGRLCLLGEHTDYNDGLVLPIAIEYGINLAISPSNDRTIRAISSTHTDKITIKTEHLTRTSTWADYVIGMVQEFGIHEGLDILIESDLPEGAGLSSSAALEVSTALCLDQLAGTQHSRKDLALMSKKVENEFVGVQCGIMDQFASLFGEENHAVKLDCRSLEFSQVPLSLEDCSLLVVNSNLKHTLTDGSLNERFDECRIAVNSLMNPGIKSLRNLFELSEDRLLVSKLEEPFQSRAHYILFAIQQVQEFEGVRNRSDLENFAKICLDAHHALDQDYGVVIEKTRRLMKLIAEQAGVLGGKMSGAGFGGSLFVILETSRTESFKKAVLDGCKTAKLPRPDFLPVTPSKGAVLFA